jgi:hypothetical protein
MGPAQPATKRSPNILPNEYNPLSQQCVIASKLLAMLTPKFRRIVEPGGCTVEYHTYERRIFLHEYTGWIFRFFF